MRRELPPAVLDAARQIHREVWGGTYREGQGPMHYASGTYWHRELHRLADRWERLAKAARVCASHLPATDREAEAEAERFRAEVDALRQEDRP
jgi:hypothetical protein